MQVHILSKGPATDVTTPMLPEPSDEDVCNWLNVNGLPGSPVLVAYEDHGYAPRFCHVSAKHRAFTQGGKRVHGWAIWRWGDPSGHSTDTMIVAQHHSVWETPEGQLIDVTPPLSGGSTVLFLRDDTAKIVFANGRFRMHTDRTDFIECPRLLRNVPSSDFYLLDLNKPDLVKYSQQLGFAVRDMATDSQHG